MTTEGTWIGYSGTAQIGLAVILLAVAGGLAYAATRWPGPFEARRPRPAVANVMPFRSIGVVLVFIVILVITTRQAPAVRLWSALLGTLAAPMIFELPFDLIVMTRTYPIPPDPALYRVLFFLPLFAVELTTLALLTLSP